jgi:hypothetical protein
MTEVGPLQWKDSPNGHRSRAQGVDGEYRIGRHHRHAASWPEQGVQIPERTRFVVRWHWRPNETEYDRFRPLYIGEAETLGAAKALAQAHHDETK